MKGILFSEALFPLVVDGSKTQTRRIIKPQPKDCTEDHKKFTGAAWANDKMDLQPDRNILSPDDWDSSFCCCLCGNGTNWRTGKSIIKPEYKIGSKVYLKEPYYTNDCGTTYYKFLNKENDLYMIENGFKWKNKMFMPTSASRYTIDILNVRAERLQDISEEDCIKEGIISRVKATKPYETIYQIPNNPNYYYTAKQAYSVLIDSINGKDTWESNPFVWVYDFKLLNQ